MRSGVSHSRLVLPTNETVICRANAIPSVIAIHREKTANHTCNAANASTTEMRLKHFKVAKRREWRRIAAIRDRVHEQTRCIDSLKFREVDQRQ